ncbi:hypothetical protein P7C71_g166, partial [Lecanoromycetidae sp. Uapishka_2]
MSYRYSSSEYTYYENNDGTFSSHSSYACNSSQFATPNHALRSVRQDSCSHCFPAYLPQVWYYDHEDIDVYSRMANRPDTTDIWHTRNERDISTLPSSLQTVARDVDKEFIRLEKEAKALEREKARHQYDVKKYEEAKHAIAKEWSKYLARHDDICKEKTRIEASDKSTRRSTQDTLTSRGPSRRESTKTSTYDEPRSRVDSSRNTVRHDESKTRRPEESRTTRSRDSTTRRPEDTKTTRRTSQSSRHHDKTRANDESSYGKTNSHRDEKTKSNSGWSGSTSRPKEETRSSKHNGEHRKHRPRLGETLADIIEERVLPDHYGTLAISRQSTAAEIKRATKLARVLSHPDKLKKPGMSSKELREIDDFAAAVGQAADVLTDPVQKEAYDRAWNRR